jgi:hypothetical protein
MFYMTLAKKDFVEAECEDYPGRTFHYEYCDSRHSPIAFNPQQLFS